MTTHDQASPANEHHLAVQAGVAFARSEGQGWLAMIGRDRLTFLQRLTTNDLRDLAPGQGRPTVLCTGTGRVIALLVAYVGRETVFVRTEPGQGAAIAHQLNKLIFWNDELQVADTSDRVAQWRLLGPAAGEILAGLAGSPDLAGLAPYAWIEAAVGGEPVMIQRGGPLENADWHVVAGASGADTVEAALAAQASHLDPALLESMRVEAGVPAWGHELNDQVTPLEVGLAAAVSFNKGCYTGQEVIARQHNYDKVTRLLAGLLLPGGAGPELQGAGVRPAGAAAGRPGFVGTVVRSPGLGRPIALAVVPRDAATPGSTVVVLKDGAEIEAEVSALPFRTPARH